MNLNFKKIINDHCQLWYKCYIEVREECLLLTSEINCCNVTRNLKYLREDQNNLPFFLKISKKENIKINSSLPSLKPSICTFFV